MPQSIHDTINKLNKLTKPFAKLIAVALYSTAQGLQDAYVCQTIWGFLSNKNQHEQTAPVAVAAITSLAAVPLAITIVSGSNTNEQHRVNEHEHGTCHKVCHKISDLVVVGAPFGLLAFSGSLVFLENTQNYSEKLKYSISAFLGIVAAVGNAELHGRNIHAEVGYLALLTRIPQNKRCLAVYLSGFIFISHLFQGFFAGHSFFDSTDIHNKTAEIIFPSIIGILVTIFEGNTEMRSSLLNMLNDKTHSWASKIVTTLASFTHGVLPATGLLQMIKLIYEQSTKQELADHIPLWGRILVCMALIPVWESNARGFYNTTINAMDETVTTIGKSLKSTWPFCNFFSSEHESLLEDNPVNIGRSVSMRYDAIV